MEQSVMAKIKSLLYYEVGNYMEMEKRLTELKGRFELHKELASHFEKGYENLIENRDLIFLQLDCLYQSSGFVVQLQRILQAIQNAVEYQKATGGGYPQSEFSQLKKITKIFRNGYEDTKTNLIKLQSQVDDLLPKIICYKRILTSLKYQTLISREEIVMLSQFMDAKELPSREQVEILERVKIYNQTIFEKEQKKRFTKDKYEILNILNLGFEVFPSMQLDPLLKVQVQKEAEIQYQLLNFFLKDGSAEEYVEQVKLTYEFEPDRDKVKAVIYAILKKMQQMMLEETQALGMKEFYLEPKLKLEIIKEFQDQRAFYLALRELANTYEMSPIIEEEKVEETTTTGNNYLIFAKNASQEPFFMRDLKEVPNEYLGRVNELLQNFQDGTIPAHKIRIFNNNRYDLRELKEDQIRIGYRKVGNQVYCILGVGVKKANTDRALCERLDARGVPKYKTEQELLALMNHDQQVLADISTYCTEAARKGTR